MPPKQEGYAESQTGSIYGRETYYDHGGFSPAPSQGGMYPPPGYQSGRNTPQSHFRGISETGHLLHQPIPSRPVTNYLDIPNIGSPDHFNTQPAGTPSDADIEKAVQNLLRGADLNSVTKREVRRQLEDEFGMDLTARKASINAAIDRALLSGL